ncbi:hypothetical protein [Actinomadura sp. 7K507]|uniref:hypothetical protein n=1 Tax=Actinomadura sp. 7K507 TaxID=2530365 RepID=UPI00105046EF|nr:hypothetical protein [Actinomadura sp. 7K507]TDC86271.1 hypothetical protein E1285_23935 [Actinomadura sp. 7K507]
MAERSSRRAVVVSVFVFVVAAVLGIGQLLDMIAYDASLLTAIASGFGLFCAVVTSMKHLGRRGDSTADRE